MKNANALLQSVYMQSLVINMIGSTLSTQKIYK